MGTNPYSGLEEKSADEKPKDNPYAKLEEKKDYALSDVPAAAWESVKKIPDEVVEAATHPLETGKAVAGSVAALGNLALRPAHTAIRGLLNAAGARESSDWYTKNFIQPGEQFLDDYQDKYGGWLGGPGKWGWTPEQGWSNVKRTMAEHPVSAVLDFGTAVAPAARALKGPKIPPIPTMTADEAARAAALRAAGIDSPTRSMLTGNKEHQALEDAMRQGRHGEQAQTLINDADQLRMEGLDANTSKLRASLTGAPTPMSPLEVGATISERAQAAHEAAKQKVRDAYKKAFDPAELQAAGVPSHVPTPILTDLGTNIRNKLLSGDQPFVATREAAPNTAQAVSALDDYARTGRLPSVVGSPVVGEVMPPVPGSGTSWQSMDSMRKYINGLRESSRQNPTDLLGMRKVLDAFDETLGKANSLINDARQQHKYRVALFDPNRNKAGAGVRNVLQAALNPENTGFTLYNKLFDGAHMQKGEALKTVDHIKRIFANDPEGMTAVKEGALQRLFHDPKNYDPLSPQKSVTALNNALKGPARHVYKELFLPEELEKLHNQLEARKIVATRMQRMNPSGSGDTIEISKRKQKFEDDAAKRIQAKLDLAGTVAGAAAGWSLGSPLGHGPAGAMTGAPIFGAGTHYGTSLITQRLAPGAGKRALAKADAEAAAQAELVNKGLAPSKPGYAEGGAVDDSTDDTRIQMIQSMLARSGAAGQRLAMPQMAAPNPLAAMRMPSPFAADPPQPDPPGTRIPPFLPAPRPIEATRNAPMEQAAEMQSKGIDQLTKAAKTKTDEDETKKKIEELLAKAGIARERVYAAQTAAPAAAAASPSPIVSFSGDMSSYVKGLTGGLETGPANPNDVNPDTGAAGRFQFQPSTVASMIRNDPSLAKQIDDNWRTDKLQQNILLSRYTEISDNMIKQITGRPATNPERYAMHLLGHGLGSKVVSNPDAPIESFLGKEAWDQHLKYNPRLLTPGITGRDLMLKVAPNFKGAE